MDENRKIQIKNFMKNKLGIEIGDKYIEDYDQALMHYIDNRQKGTREPKRLAFLGDSPLVGNENGWKKISEKSG